MKLVIAGGGTGGHIIPALAIADQLTAECEAAGSQAEILFIGTPRGLESKLVPQAGYPLSLIKVGQLNNVSLLTRVRTLLDLPLSVMGCMRMLRKYRPNAVVGVGGYAKPMPPSWMARQKIEVAKRVAMADIVISTALIPGRAAPTLITEDMVKAMKPGSVIVDIAAGKGPNLAGEIGGGNCPLTVAGQTVKVHGVTIVGETNLPALVAADASALYARNVLDFLKLILTKEGTLAVPMDDDIVAACLMTQNGELKRT